MPHHSSPPGGTTSSWPQNLALLALLAIGAFFLLAEHRAHLFGLLPFAFILLCPLLHMFMHGGHGGHGRQGGEPRGTGPTGHSGHASGRIYSTGRKP